MRALDMCAPCLALLVEVEAREADALLLLHLQTAESSNVNAGVHSDKVAPTNRDM